MKGINKHLIESLSQDRYDMDLDGMERPQYLESLEDEIDEPKQPGMVQNYIDEIWVSQPRLIEESLEKLEAEDNEYRNRLSKISEKDKRQADQLLLQKQLNLELLDLALKLHRIPTFTSVKGIKKALRNILQSLLSAQSDLTSQKTKSKKLSKIPDNTEIVWNFMTDLARE